MFASWFSLRQARASFAEGSAALDRGDDDLALSWFNTAVRENGRFALGYLGRGLARLRKGEFDAAIADLSEAIRLSGDARGYFLRALGYEGKGDRTREQADRREALRRDPRVARSLHVAVA
jgi:tetratricopeptide (TPR) repeat protein